MKTERKHELQTNQLADALGHELDYIKPYLKTIVGVLIAVAAVGITFAFIASQRAAKNAAAWSDYYTVVTEADAKAMEELAKTHAGSDAGLWASLSAADIKLRMGSIRMFDDRGEAEVNLEQAKRDYQTVIDGAGTGSGKSILRRRAQLGLAQTLEALNDPEEAQPVYQKVVDDNKEDAFGKAAAQRLAQMKKLNDQQWYAWFDKHKPVPARDPLEGRDPFGLNNLPGENDLKAPGIIGEELMENEKSDKPESPIEFDAPKTKKTSGAPEKEGDAFPVDPAPKDEKKVDPPAEEKTPE